MVIPPSLAANRRSAAGVPCCPGAETLGMALQPRRKLTAGLIPPCPQAGRHGAAPGRRCGGARDQPPDLAPMATARPPSGC
jgi:hypothetical protein